MAPPQQQQGGGDNSMGFFWIIIGIFIAVLLLWHYQRAPIVNFIFGIKSAELYIIGFFTKSAEPIRQVIARTDASQIEFSQVITICKEVGRYLSVPCAIFLLLLAGILYKTGVNNRFRKTHNMTSLAKQERQRWPYITPILHLDLLKQPIDEGPWAMALTPMSFAKKYKLLIEHKEAVGTSGLQKDIKIVVNLNRGKANRIFANQLGRPWMGPTKLRPHSRALFAIFAAKFKGDRDPANALLRTIAISTADGKTPSFVGADNLLKKYLHDKQIEKICAAHAYELTAMASMLEAARGDGVIATAEFLWLKPIDRTLWYMLNTVGRQTAPAEVGGVMAHWLAERAIGKALVIPMIEEASIALDAALKDIIYVPDEPEGGA